ncbi:MAG: hypothetical protein ABI599_11775 [Flavobacteriales bacterium]
MVELLVLSSARFVPPSDTAGFADGSGGALVIIGVAVLLCGIVVVRVCAHHGWATTRDKLLNAAILLFSLAPLALVTMLNLLMKG